MSFASRLGQTISRTSLRSQSLLHIFKRWKIKPMSRFLSRATIFMGAGIGVASIIQQQATDFNVDYSSLRSSFSRLFPKISIASAMENDDVEIRDKKWLEEIQKSADEGNIEAAFLFATEMIGGNITRPDAEKAVHYFQKAFDGGIAEAAYNIGIIRFYGISSPKNEQDGLKWLELACEQGSIESMNQLGSIYANGTFVKHDKKKAFEYFNSSAILGDPVGLYNSAIIILNGHVPSIPIITALDYFEKAAAQKHGKSAFYAAAMLHRGITGHPNYSKALDYYNVAHQLGDDDATAQLGIAHLLGVTKSASNLMTHSVPANPNLGIEMLVASSKSSSIAQRVLGQLYNSTKEQLSKLHIDPQILQSKSIDLINNISTTKDIIDSNQLSGLSNDNSTFPDLKMARRLFESCTKLGNQECRVEMGMMILQHPDLFKTESISSGKQQPITSQQAGISNPAFAFRLISAAADSGNGEALLKRGALHYFGIGTDQSDKKALQDFKSACELDISIAAYFVALMLKDGRGTKKEQKNFTEALNYANLAATSGYEPAKEAATMLNTELKLNDKVFEHVELHMKEMLFKPTLFPQFEL